MSGRIKFSIAIPAYKTKYLGEGIRSCLKQEYDNFEVVIVDDCSPEDVYSVVSRFSDQRIRYFRNKENCGAVNVVDNWNICLSYCTGDYIICMGDDDKLLPCCLSEYVKLIEKYPHAKVFHGWTEIIDENSEYVKMQHPRPVFEGAASLLWNRWHGRDLQFIGDFCYNIKQLREDGGFYKLPMAWGSDDITAVRAARIGGIANSQCLCFQYRQNRHTISNTGSQDIKMKATLLEKEWYLYFLRDYQPTDEIEEKYIKNISDTINQHFLEKYKLQMTRDMANNYWRLFHWLRYRKKYGVSMLKVFIAFVKALKE